MIQWTDKTETVAMSRQQMSFELAYAQGTTTTCKSCKSPVDTGCLIIGVKSESMYDPMWYHVHCFWTRCWYRKQMSRHTTDFTELPGFSSLTVEDKNSFTEALQDLTGQLRVTSSNASRLKRRSVSDDNLLDAVKKSKPDAVLLPKLPLSATGFLSKSTSNLSNATGDAADEGRKDTSVESLEKAKHNNASD